MTKFRQPTQLQLSTWFLDCPYHHQNTEYYLINKSTLLTILEFRQNLAMLTLQFPSEGPQLYMALQWWQLLFGQSTPYVVN